MKKTLLNVVPVLLCVMPAWGQGPVPLGNELQINAYTTGGQRSPAAATLTDGSFVVVWGSDEVGAYSHYPAIQGRRLSPEGDAIGEEFRVETSQIVRAPVVSGLADGGFVVLWNKLGSVGLTAVEGQRYAADGTPAGEPFEVSHTFTTTMIFDLAVAALADGGFVVLWQGPVSNGAVTTPGIYGRRYAAGGAELEEPFQVSTVTFGDETRPSVAGLADGGFVALWQSRGTSDQDVSGSSIQGRRYAADGAPAGGLFQVNTYTTGYQESPSVAATGDGGFVVVWQSFGSGGSDSLFDASIQGQRFAADGVAAGGELQVNAYTAFDQWRPAVTPDGDGFLATWQSDGSSGDDASGTSIQGRRFAAPRFALAGAGGKCLDAGTPDDTAVTLADCHGGTDQRWRLDLASVPQQIEGPGGQCLRLGTADDGGMPGAVVGDCENGQHRWRLATPDHARPSVLVHVGSGLCLAAGDDGTALAAYCGGGDAELFWRPAAEICTRDSLGLCLNQARFRVDLAWRSFDGTTGTSRAVPVGGGDSGLLWFFEADNWELLIKVLDGCAINDRFWVFAAATTTVEYSLTVTDTATGEIREYFNPLGAAAAAITDTDGFATCSAATGIAGPPAARTVSGSRSFGVSDEAPTRDVESTCAPSPTSLCLSGGRFLIEAEWRDYQDETGSARAVPVTSDDSGLLWFFDADNWEMLIKVLDACHLDDARFLMLAAATTDVEYTLRVTDTETGDAREYFNPLGNASPALVDSFYTCPAAREPSLRGSG